MIEKLYKKVKNIQDFNETASKLRQMGLKDELKNLAGKYKVPEVDLKEFLSGKRYFLIDGGETVSYTHLGRCICQMYGSSRILYAE